MRSQSSKVDARGRSEELVRLAEAQRGVVHRDQLRALGFSTAWIDRALARRQLRLIRHSVYALGHRPQWVDAQLYAALLSGGPRSELSHGTGAWMHALIAHPPPLVHVTGPERRESSATICFHRLEADALPPPVLVRGLRVVPVAHALLGLAATSTVPEVRRAIGQADFRRVLDVQAAGRLCQRGRPGSGTLRRALADHALGLRTESELEDRFVALLRRGRIPLPLFNVTLAGMRVDALWRTERLVVELDGAAAHATTARMSRDRDRDLRLRAAGLRVARYDWSQVTRTPQDVAADLRTLLGLRTPRSAGRTEWRN